MKTQSTFEKKILNDTKNIDQKGKLISVNPSGTYDVLNPIFSVENGFIFNNGLNLVIKIETEMEDFIYRTGINDFEGAKKILKTKLKEHS